MNKEEKITISVNEENLQNIINAYEKDIEYINQLEKENQRLKEIEKEHQRINGCLHLEIKELKDRIDKAVEYIEKHRQIYDIDGSLEPKIDEFSILASPKYLIDLLKGGKK